MLHKHARVQKKKQIHLVTDKCSTVRVVNVLLLCNRILIHCVNCTFTFYASQLLMCLSHTCICVGVSVVISPLLALDVEGRELGE